MTRHMFHQAHPADRASILARGIATAFDRTSEEPCRVFLSTEPTTGRADTWRVDVTGLDLVEDLTDRDEVEFPGQCYEHYGDIGPERLELVEGSPMPFTPAEAAFLAVLGEVEEMMAQPDEPEVGFVPCGALKRRLWEAAVGMRAEGLRAFKDAKAEEAAVPRGESPQDAMDQHEGRRADA